MQNLPFCFILFFVHLYFFSYSQDTLPVDTSNLNKSLIVEQNDSTIANNQNKRIWLVSGIHVVIYTGSLIALNNAWYKDYSKTSFHTFNDTREWLQVDKVGHSWSAYNIAKYSSAMWKWVGVSQNKSTWIGGLSSIVYLSIIEYLDAHSSKWGWSWADMSANFFGSGLYISQELLWKQQRIQFKFSSHKASYDASLKKRTNDLFGNSLPEKILKDYNTQTYWLSANLKSFFPDSHLPCWLNISAGYGANGLLGGFENRWIGEDGNTITRYDILRKRQFYFAPDVDFTKIKTNNKSIRTMLNVLNMIKFPAPALMIDSKGNLKGYVIYF